MGKSKKKVESEEEEEEEEEEEVPPTDEEDEDEDEDEDEEEDSKKKSSKGSKKAKSSKKKSKKEKKEKKQKKDKKETKKEYESDEEDIDEEDDFESQLDESFHSREDHGSEMASQMSDDESIDHAPNGIKRKGEPNPMLGKKGEIEEQEVVADEVHVDVDGDPISPLDISKDDSIATFDNMLFENDGDIESSPSPKSPFSKGTSFESSLERHDESTEKEIDEEEAERKRRKKERRASRKAEAKRIEEKRKKKEEQSTEDGGCCGMSTTFCAMLVFCLLLVIGAIVGGIMASQSGGGSDDSSPEVAELATNLVFQQQEQRVLSPAEREAETLRAQELFWKDSKFNREDFNAESTVKTDGGFSLADFIPPPPQ